MNKDSKIYVAGHTGMVGSAICRALEAAGFRNVLTVPHVVVDLKDGMQVGGWFSQLQPEYVFLAAAVVGGIAANAARPVEFLCDNLQMELNVIRAAQRYGVKKLLFLGSSCIYPRDCEQPIKEEALLTGPLETTNEWYAIAKIAGIKMCQAYRKQFGCDFISAMPTNLYGQGDNYEAARAHVLPAMIRRFHEAAEEGNQGSAAGTSPSPPGRGGMSGSAGSMQSVTCWGTGKPRREFLYVDDLAASCLLLMERYSDPLPINVGFGEDVTIATLAGLVKEVVGYDGGIEWDHTKPDGTPRKLLDSTRMMNLGWRPKVGLIEGIKMAYLDFLKRAHTGQVLIDQGGGAAPPYRD